MSNGTGRPAEAPEPLRFGPKALAAVGANPTEARAPPAVGRPGPPDVGSGGQVRMGAANPGRGVTALGLAAMGQVGLGGNASAFPLALGRGDAGPGVVQAAALRGESAVAVIAALRGDDSDEPDHEEITTSSVSGQLDQLCYVRIRGRKTTSQGHDCQVACFVVLFMTCVPRIPSSVAAGALPPATGAAARPAAASAGAAPALPAPKRRRRA